MIISRWLTAFVSTNFSGVLLKICDILCLDVGEKSLIFISYSPGQVFVWEYKADYR